MYLSVATAVWLSLSFAWLVEADLCPDGKDCTSGCCIRKQGEYYCCAEDSGGSVVVISPFRLARSVVIWAWLAN